MLIEDAFRQDHSHHSLRRCIPIPEPSVFKSMVKGKGSGRCHTGTSEEICRIRLDCSIVINTTLHIVLQLQSRIKMWYKCVGISAYIWRTYFT